MISPLSWAAAAPAAAVIFALSPSAVARPYTVDDLLRLEVLAGVEATPDGRYLLIHTYGPAASAGRFGDDGWPQPELSRLYRVDVRKDAARLVYPVTAGTGVLPGPMAPSSDRMVVYQLAGLRWRAGVLDLETLRTRWTDLAPELALYGRTVQWLGDDRVVAITLRPGEAPGRLAMSWRTRTQRSAAWNDTALGAAPSYRLLGSGAALQWGRPAPAHHLELRDLKTGVSQRFAAGDFLDLEASPSGRYVALLEEDEAVAPPASATVKVGSPSRWRRVQLVDLRSGASLKVCPTLFAYSHLLSWSPSGDELLVSGEQHGVGIVARVRAVDGRCTQLAAPNLEPKIEQTSEGIRFLHAGWLGDTPVTYLQRSDAREDRADWYRWIDGRAINLTADLDEPPSRAARLGPDGLVLATSAGLWRAAADGRSGLMSGAGPTPLRPGDLSEGARFGENPPTDVGGLHAEDGRALPQVGSSARPSGDVLWADARSTVVGVTDTHGETRLVLTSDAATRTVLTLNTFLEEVDTPGVRSVSYRTATGEAALGWLYLPTVAAKRPPPLIVVPYPGTTFVRAPKASALGQPDFALGVQVLLGAGFAVLEPSLPVNRHADEPAANLTRTILAATDAALATGAVDPARLAIFGHSFGGYAALVAATETDRFKAVIAYASPLNLTASWGTINPLFSEHPTFDGVINAQPGWADGGQAHLWSPPWEASDRYVRNSPFFRADRITAPTLLISADHDFAPLAQNEALFSAFYRLHRDAALLSFWGEGHAVTSPANLRVLYASIEDWLNTHLTREGTSIGPMDEPLADARPPANPRLGRDKL